MNNLLSIFLSQTYQDCWADYERPIKTNNFPRWDYVILTASDEQKAEGFRKQIKAREKYLPGVTRFVVIPDRGGERVGSSGGVINRLEYYRSKVDLE